MKHFNNYEFEEYTRADIEEIITDIYKKSDEVFEKVMNLQEMYFDGYGLPGKELIDLERRISKELKVLGIKVKTFAGFIWNYDEEFEDLGA